MSEIPTGTHAGPAAPSAATAAATGGEPLRGRPVLPAAYGMPAGPSPDQVPWSWALERLTGARNYWLCTTSPDGTPHVMPLWALWRSGALMFSADPSSRKIRNLAGTPRAAVHLESGDDVVVLHGSVDAVTEPGERAGFWDAYAGKYDFRPDPADPAFGVYRMRPDVGLGWRQDGFPATMSRWTFPASSTDPARGTPRPAPPP
jgi:hypothetical protein